MPHIVEKMPNGSNFILKNASYDLVVDNSFGSGVLGRSRILSCKRNRNGSEVRGIRCGGRG